MNFIFEDTATNSAAEQEELFKALTEKALAGDSTGFEYIKSTAEWRVIRQARAGLSKVIELYSLVIKGLYKEYCKQVLDGSSDFNILYALRQYQECEAFYRAELDTTENMLDEYDAYLGRGHFLDQFLWGRARESWHLWDHRGASPYGN